MTGQPAWKAIADEDPDALLLLGDNVYLGSNTIGTPPSADPVTRVKAARLLTRELRARYAEQFAEKNFRDLMIKLGLLDQNGKRKSDAELAAAPSKVFPIYDDHDFLGNDRYGGDPRNKELRTAARNVFLETFGRRNWAGVSLFSITRGLGGLVDVVVLDGRFYRKSPSATPNDADSMLGHHQWSWFERGLLKEPPAKYTVMLSGSTVQNYGIPGQESWQAYPEAYGRLKADVGDRRGALVVSGDIHTNRFSSVDGVVEIVCSGVATRTENTLLGDERRNYGILTFDEEALHVSLHKIDSEKHFTLPLASWAQQQVLLEAPFPVDPPAVIDLRDPQDVPANP